MKKILTLLFLISGLSFSNTCKWVSDPDTATQKYISVIKKYNLTDKIYCDDEGDLMTYWTGDEDEGELEYIEIGFNLDDIDIDSTPYKEFINLYEKFAPTLKVFDEVKLLNDEKPDYVAFRTYVRDSKTNERVMLFKLEKDMETGKNTLYYNSEFFENSKEFIDYANKLDNFYPTDDVIY